MPARGDRVDLIVFPDPITELITYLSQYFPDDDIAQDPRPDSYVGLYIQVLDAGGGPWEQVFDDVRVTVEVSEGDSVKASDAARLCDALLRAFHTSRGRWLATLSRPRYTPDPDMRVPAYQLTHTLRFRGDEVTAP